MRLYAEQIAQYLPRVCQDRQVSFQLKHFPAKQSAMNHRLRYLSYPRWARRQAADLCHVTDHSYADLLWWLPRGRTVLTCHDLIPLWKEAFPSEATFLSRSTYFRFRFYTFPAFRRAMRIIAGSENTRQDILRFGRLSPDWVEVVPYGVDPAFKPPSEASEKMRIRRRHGFSDEEKVVLHVGSSLFYKNMEGILRALAWLRQEMKEPCRLLKVGQPLTPAQRALAESLGLNEMVYEWLQVNQEQLLAAYQLSDVLCFPSYYEGFGLPLIEAMACGLPVVTSNVSAPPEVVGEAALTVSPRDPEAIAQALYRVLTDKNLGQELIDRGLARAREFTWERTARETWRVYQQVLAAHEGMERCRLPW